MSFGALLLVVSTHAVVIQKINLAHAQNITILKATVGKLIILKGKS